MNEALYQMDRLNEKIITLEDIRNNLGASSVVIRGVSGEEASRISEALTALHEVIQQDQVFQNIITTVTDILNAANTIISAAGKGSVPARLAKMAKRFRVSKTAEKVLKFRVTAHKLNVRAEPKLTGDVIGTLEKDEIVELVSTSGDNYWHKIKRLDGLVGWSSHKYLVKEADGIVTPEKFPWMPIAMKEIGVKEFSGAADNPRVVEYLRSTTLGDPYRSNDETSWCSAFANWCVEKAGFAGTDSAMARSWLHWGEETDTPERGCIVVFWREDPDGPYGHVGFFVRETDAGIVVLGGNQSDQVLRAPRIRIGCSATDCPAKNSKYGNSSAI